MEAVLERLDRLTREEAQTTATQTLELVYGLVKNIKVVMDGARGLSDSSPRCIDFHHHHHLGGSVLMDDVHRTLGMFHSLDALSLLTAVPVLIQQLASDINKSRRVFNCCGSSTVDDGLRPHCR